MSARPSSGLIGIALGAAGAMTAACATNEPRPVTERSGPLEPLSPSQFVEPAASTRSSSPIGAYQADTPTSATEEVAPTAWVDGHRRLDLPTALGIGGASSLQVELAREQLEEASARLDAAESLWIPDVRAGLLYNKHEGALQRTEGDVLQVSRDSGYVGGGLFARVDLADAFLQPGAARHDVDAAGAGVTTSMNDTLLGVALSYNDLLTAQSLQVVAEQNVTLARELVDLTAAFSSTGQGLEADAARARNELAFRQRQVIAAEQTVETRSALLATQLRLDPTTGLRAEDPRLVPLSLIAADTDLNDLIHLAATSRPEIRGFMSTVRAEEERQRQETLRPFIPSVLLGVTAGGLGGGTGSSYEDFSSAGDLTLGLTWGIRNLGFGESAIRRQEAAQTRTARVRLRMALDAVSQQVTIAHLEVRQGRRQVELAVENVDQSLNSLDLNMQRIHAAEGLPIEALQAMRAAAEAQETYLESVSAFNRAQFRLLRAVGRSPRRSALDGPPGGE